MYMPDLLLDINALANFTYALKHVISK